MRGIDHLHPTARKLAVKLTALCAAKGLPVLITDTYRTKTEQDALYAKGRTEVGRIVTNVKYPDSAHCWGVAFDFAKNVRGHEYDDPKFFYEVGQIAKSIGLAWGGDFRGFADGPHLEVAEFMPGNNTKMLKTKYGTPEAFKATWMHGANAAQKEIIQNYCHFDNPEVVWSLLDAHPYAESLYIKWADSYK